MPEIGFARRSVTRGRGNAGASSPIGGPAPPQRHRKSTRAPGVAALMAGRAPFERGYRIDPADPALGPLRRDRSDGLRDACLAKAHFVSRMSALPGDRSGTRAARTRAGDVVRPPQRPRRRRGRRPPNRLSRNCTRIAPATGGTLRGATSGRFATSTEPLRHGWTSPEARGGRARPAVGR